MLYRSGTRGSLLLCREALAGALLVTAAAGCGPSRDAAEAPPAPAVAVEPQAASPPPRTAGEAPGGPPPQRAGTVRPHRTAVAQAPRKKVTARQPAPTANAGTAPPIESSASPAPAATPRRRPQPSASAAPQQQRPAQQQSSAPVAEALHTETDAPPQPTAVRPDEVVFQTLSTPEPITLMAMTEDGQYLLMSHQGSDQVTIYDVQAERFIGSLNTPSPRSILCRGNRVFVANYGEGTISVFQRGEKWKQVDELQVEKPLIVHLSAPQGKNFRSELIVTCHGEGREASYQDAHIFRLEVSRDRETKVAQDALASVSYDGKIVLTQSSFNLSPSGMAAGYSYRDFTGAGKPNPLFRTHAEDLQTPYLYQVHHGSYWLANDMIFGGVPLKMLKETDDRPLIPDLAHRIIYLLSTDRLSAHRLDATLTEIGHRRVQLPGELYSQFDRIARDLFRRREYLIDHPVACTHGSTLHLFVIDHETSTVLRAKTAAFGTVAKTVFAPGGAAPVATDAAGGVADSNPEQLGVPERVAEGSSVSVQLTGTEASRYELMTGPPTMKLTADGGLTWRPDVDDLGMHQLKIRVTDGSRVAFHRPTIEVIARELAAASGGALQTIDAGERLPLEPDHVQLIPDKLFSSLLLLQGDRLRRLGPDGLSVREDINLPDRYRWIAERGDAWIAIAAGPHRLDVIDRSSRRVVKEIQLQAPGVRVMEVHDLAIHPQQRISYVAIKHDIHLPRYRILMVEEPTGRIAAPDAMLGKYLAIDPGGRYLYTAYSDIYERGANFHLNPDWRIIVTPEYGGIDWLISYDLPRGGTPSVREVLQEAGGNATGLRLSPDGRRITYLSVVGYPPHSKNLAGFDPTDFESAPVVYPTKDQAVTTHLAYHPTLPLVAVPSEKSIALFHRETGKPVKNRLLLTSEGLGDVQVEQLQFSPDGRSILVICGGPEGRYLRRVGLRPDR